MSIIEGTSSTTPTASAAATEPDVNKLNLSENDWQNVFKNLSSSSMNSLKKVLGGDKPPAAPGTPGPPLVHIPVLNNHQQTPQGSQTILVALTANNTIPSMTNIKPIGQTPSITTLGHLTTPAISAPISTLGPTQTRCLTLNQILAANQIAGLLQQNQNLLKSKIITNSKPVLMPANGLNQNGIATSPLVTTSSSNPQMKKDASNNSLYALAAAAVEVADSNKVENCTTPTSADIKPEQLTSPTNEEELKRVLEKAIEHQKRKCLVETRTENINSSLVTTVASTGGNNLTTTDSPPLEGTNLHKRKIQEVKLEPPDNMENMEPIALSGKLPQNRSSNNMTHQLNEAMSNSDLEDDESDGSYTKDDVISVNRSNSGIMAEDEAGEDMDGLSRQQRKNFRILRSNVPSQNSIEDSVYDTEAMRRAKRRERNRVAAARCRQRRQDQIGELQNQVTQLYQTGETLRNQIKLMAFERNRLERQIQLHNMTECPKSLTLNPPSPYKETDLPPLTKILRLETTPAITTAPPVSMAQTSQGFLKASEIRNQRIRPKATGEDVQNSSSNDSGTEDVKKEVKTISIESGSKPISRPNSLNLPTKEVVIKKDPDQLPATLQAPVLATTAGSTFGNTTPALTPSTLRLLGQLAGTPTLNQTTSPFIPSSLDAAVTTSTSSPLACLRLNSALNLLSPNIDLQSLGIGQTGNLAALNGLQHAVANGDHQQPQQPLFAISSSIENGLQIFRMISNPSPVTSTNNQ